MESPRGLSARNDGVSPLFNIFWRIWPMRVAPWLLTSMILAATPFPIGAQSAPEGDFNLPPELTILGPTDPSVRKATAIVNGELITDTDIEHRLNLVLTANRGQVDAEERERLRMQVRSEEHTSDLQSLMRTPYTALCL